MSEKLWLHKKINSLTALRIIFFLLISIAQKHLNNILAHHKIKEK